MVQPVSLPAALTEPGLVEELTAIVARAAAAILAIAPAALMTRAKLDHSPVTAADEAAEAVILAGLDRLMPGIPVISEEAAASGHPASLPSIFVLVDPLDGTQELVAGRPEFTVNVAVIAHSTPVVGVVAGPALSRLWRGVVGKAAERLLLVAGEVAGEATAIRTRSAPPRLIATVSRSHHDPATEAFLARLPVAETRTIGSSVKLCLVAEGSADVYPRLAPTSEWDIAAGHAILAAAGGTLTAPGGEPVVYGNAAQSFRLPSFVAWGDAAAARLYGC